MYDRSRLATGDVIDGPATDTTASDAADAERREDEAEAAAGIIVASPTGSAGGGDSDDTASAPAEPDPVMLEIFNNQFAGIADRKSVV